METIKRQRRGADTWRELVARQEQSGLSALRFCEQEDVQPASFYAWRSRLRKLVEHTNTSPRSSREPQRQKAVEEFIDLGALDSRRSRFEVRLDLGGGVLLQLVRS